jgi:hypothetical protein
MVGSAKRLMIIRVIEERVIRPGHRYDVVNYCGRCHPALFLTLSTEGMLG